MTDIKSVVALFLYTTYVAMLIPVVALYTMKLGIFGYYRGVVLFGLLRKKEAEENGKVEESEETGTKES